MDNSTTEGASPLSGEGLPLTLVHSIIGLLGIIGNSLVVYLTVRVPSLRSVTNVLICNQSIIDLTSCIFFVCLYLFPRPSLPKSDVAAGVVCKLWLSDWPLWGLLVASTANLVLLTFERYAAILHPINYRCRLSMRRVKFLAVVPWLVGPLHELGWALVQTVDKEGNCKPDWPSVALQRALGVVFFTGHYVIPVSLVVFVYTRIILTLRRDWRSGLKSCASTQNVCDREISKANGRKRFTFLASRSVLRTLLLVSASYVICWGPNEIIYLLFNLGVPVQFGSLYHELSVTFVLCNMCLNPVIYAFHYDDFKKALRESFRCSMRARLQLKLPCMRSCEHEADERPATVAGTSQLTISDITSV